MNDSPSGTGYHRRKNPEGVRAALLAAAADLARRDGVQSLTIQAVAAMAGVTKGGLLHHFPGRDALLNALGDLALTEFGTELDRLMAADPEPSGRFTRAYVRSALAPQAVCGSGVEPQLITALWGEPGLRRQWYDWIAAQEARHAGTDGSPSLKLVRFAADGVWMALSDGIEASAWLPQLLAATRA